MDRARSWTELLDQLYDASWNSELQHFRSPFAFRGLSHADHRLVNRLTRLAGGHRQIATLEASMLRNFRKYAAPQAPTRVNSIWHWLSVEPSRRWWPSRRDGTSGRIRTRRSRSLERYYFPRPRD